MNDTDEAARLRKRIAELEAEIATRPIVTIKSEVDARTIWPSEGRPMTITGPGVRYTVTIELPGEVCEFTGTEMTAHLRPS